MWIYEAMLGVALVERATSAVDVLGVQYDSRRIERGDVFVAMQGGSADGNQFIAAAIARGAVAVVTDSRSMWERRGEFGRVPFFLVENGRRALAGIAANLFEHPERKLKISAVTGTNGKTTTAFLLEQMLRAVERKCVLIGTIENHIGDQVRASEHTTPESRDLLAMFDEGVKAGASEVVMEMSSHALEQERVWGLHVDVAIFTNLTQDHLDFHGTMEAYFAAKARMFAGLGAAPPRVAVVNADDAAGLRLMAEMQARHSGSRVMSYGISAGEYRAEDVVLRAGETLFRWITPEGAVEIASPLTGRVNVLNLLAASCAALARGLTLEDVAQAARALQQVPGRFEVVPGSAEAGFSVVVDYAHTDDALKNLIALARDLVGPQGGRVITLFGCGGDRDRSKRPKMGRAAGEGSDVVVLTSDNPRSEEPATIVAEALLGVQETAVECVVELDRAAAIRKAIALAQAGDIVLIAGKGHEKVQILRDGTVPFDDVAVATAVLALERAKN
jgi:UDP-N-acetylmuramoyl-L-alanyl-D-glutamate--2,6-diaminopimelate ligase